MAKERIQRRLAAILAADVVGYSRLMEADEAGTLAALMDAIIRAKPQAAKGTYLRSVTLASTMGPGIRVDPAQAARLSVG